MCWLALMALAGIGILIALGGVGLLVGLWQWAAALDA